MTDSVGAITARPEATFSGGEFGQIGAMVRERVLAVDVGGTKLAAGVVDPDGRVGSQARVPTGGRNADELFESLAGLVEPLLDAESVTGIGVGCGGPMSAGGGLVSPLNIPQWRNFALAGHLADRTGLPVVVDNDAKALALGEGWCGAAVGNRDYLAMVVSTGVGGGLVVDGRLLHGAAGNAGHIGHVVVEPDGPACACGRRGCLETVASGPAIQRETGRPASEADLEVRRRTGDLVGQAVATVVNLLDIPLVVVAGSVALGFGVPFFEAAQERLDRECGLEFTRDARIVPAGLGADGPLVGAAALWHHARRRSEEAGVEGTS